MTAHCDYRESGIVLFASPTILRVTVNQTLSPTTWPTLAMLCLNLAVWMDAFGQVAA